MDSLIAKMIKPFADCLTSDAARKVVSIQADADLQDRVDQLADKANRGMLTDEEKAEYDRHLATFHLVTIAQAQARRVLKS